MSLMSILADILFVGHSLVGAELPPMVQSALQDRGHEARVEAHLIPGAPLQYNWDYSDATHGVNGRARLETGEIDVLILTEAVPLDNHVTWSDSVGQVARWAGLAWEKNPETRVFVYETWHTLKSGPGVAIENDADSGIPWTDRLENDLPVWESLSGKANAERPNGSDPVRIIPAGQAMLLADAAAKAGELPGITSIDELFHDDIHPNGKGLYLVAMVQFASITGENPEGLPARLFRTWPNRAAIVSDDLAFAMQRIAWKAVTDQRAREDRTQGAADALAPVQQAVGQIRPDVLDFPPIANPNLAVGVAGISDWSVQQPFLDVMKTARPWTAHMNGQWEGLGHDDLAAAGRLDPNGWLLSAPPEAGGVSTILLTDLPPEAAGIAGRYIMRWKGKGTPLLGGRAQEQRPEAGGIGFDFRPGEGGVIITMPAIDPSDPIRDITVVRADRMADLDAGRLFNPDWLNRIRGVKLIRLMDWMETNNSKLAALADRPRMTDYTWARKGVPVEVMVALANELNADPWFTLPHLAEDDLVGEYARIVQSELRPERRAWVEYSNEMWNEMFGQARWAKERAVERWGDDRAGVQYYAMRASEIADIWAEVFTDDSRLVRVIATHTGWLGREADILDAPLVVAEGRPEPYRSFDAYAVTGYFSARLVDDEKYAMVKEWLAESRAADPSNPLALALARGAEEVEDGRHSGKPEGSIDDMLTNVFPHHAEVARDHGLQLVMYEGGSHIVGLGAALDDPEIATYLTTLSYTPEIGALYRKLMAGWSELTDAPFNAFVDISYPSKWGSWGALRHLGDDNPRWQALTKG
jgi:hypothetical protein